MLAVPILKFSAGLSARQAVATSLATVGAVSFIGALLAWREKRVVWKVAGIFSMVATIGTLLGVALAQLMPDKLQMGLFVAIMLVATIRMFRQDKPPQQQSSKEAAGSLGLVVKALSVGVLTGVVGVGGGFLIVPALVALFHLPMKKATGTSLVVIAINSAVGTLRYSQAVSLNWGFTAGFVGAAVVGLVIGMNSSKKLDDDRLRTLFAYGLLMISLYTLWREFL